MSSLGRFLMNRNKYINPFTDYGFKKLFGDENNTDILIDFLNAILQGKVSPIEKIYFLDKEQLGSNLKRNTYIFDLHCESSSGERFVVEMQKNRQPSYIARSAVYGSHELIAQSNRSEERYNFKKVFIISILDFCPIEWQRYENKYRFDFTLKDDEFPEIEYDGIRYVYFVLDHFRKSLEELENNYERWLYLLQQMPKIEKGESEPEGYVSQVFSKFLSKAELANMDDYEQEVYSSSLLHYTDVKEQIKGGFQEGKEEGIEEGLSEGIAKGLAEGEARKSLHIAKALLSEGLDMATVEKVTGVSQKELSQFVP